MAVDLSGKILLAASANPEVIEVSVEAPVQRLSQEETFARELDRAFERVGDLSQYTTAQLNSAGAWVLNFPTNHSVDRALLQMQLGAAELALNELIANTYIYVPAAGLTGAQVVAQLEGVANLRHFYPLVGLERDPRAIPNDPFFPNQWHLRNTGQTGGLANADANVTGVWDRYRGDGVVIGIVDDGVQHTHPDLAANYSAALSFDFNDNDPDPAPNLAIDDHGTAVAGVAAGVGFNNLGISGAAPNATFSGLRLIGGFTPATDAQEAAAMLFQNQAIHIYNNSWGPPDTGVLEAPGPLMLAAYQNGVVNGRSGLGSVFTWAAGNGLFNDDNTNFDGYANSRYTIAVSAIDHRGQQALYSEPGSPILIAGYSAADAGDAVSGVWSTDLLGANGYNFNHTNDGDPSPDLDYTATFGGTSSATPLVSGVLALVLEANPGLTYRDVQHVLAGSARQNDPTDPGWQTNGAGFPINDKYGFGAIDAAAAVNLAENWFTVPDEVSFTTGRIPVNQPIPDNPNVIVVAQLDIPSVGVDFSLEYVEIIFDATHTFPGDLEIFLTSPAGTVSRLANPRIPFFQFPGQFRNWSFTSTNFWGEDFVGEWTMTVSDKIAQDQGTWNSLEFVFHGTEAPGSQIRGVKYFDQNQDGVRNPGEPGLAGWTIYLDLNQNGAHDPNEPFRVTNATGAYVFDVQPGTYVVAEVQQPNWQPSSPAGGRQTVTIATAGQIVDLNFGNVADPGSISGVVWNDLNRNTRRDGGEPGLERIQVYLDLNRNGELDPNEPAVFSNSDGTYHFPDVDYGTYQVAQIVPDGIDQTFPPAGFHTVFVGAGQAVTGVNFGNAFIPSSIAGVKWNDLNGDGVRAPGEPPLAGVFIFIDFNNDGVLSLGEPARLTDSQGRYRFDNLPPGDYIIREAASLGWRQTFPENGAPYNITLGPDEHITGVNFGNRTYTADFGDAPAPYPTLLSKGGAFHEIMPGPILGQTITAEPNGQPSIGANTDQDDGVVFLTPIDAGGSAQVRVTASQAGGKLNAWIDYNRNGSWDDDGEHVIIEADLPAGPTVFTFDVPTTVVPGVSYARFRLSTEPGLGPTGYAPDGEVEDYVVNLTSSIPPPDDNGGGNGNGGGQLPLTNTNPSNALDVNADGLVTLADALAIIGALRNGGARLLPPPSPPNVPPPYLDVNGDGVLSINDALRVVNRLLRNVAVGEAEGEAALAPESARSGPERLAERTVAPRVDDAVSAGDDDVRQSALALAAAEAAAASTSAAGKKSADDDDLLDLIAADIAALP